jgi:hypothetical protein
MRVCGLVLIEVRYGGGVQKRSGEEYNIACWTVWQCPGLVYTHEDLMVVHVELQQQRAAVRIPKIQQQGLMGMTFSWPEEGLRVPLG